jgi:hypothetical protein
LSAPVRQGGPKHGQTIEVSQAIKPVDILKERHMSNQQNQPGGQQGQQGQGQGQGNNQPRPDDASRQHEQQQGSRDKQQQGSQTPGNQNPGSSDGSQQNDASKRDQQRGGT